MAEKTCLVRPCHCFAVYQLHHVASRCCAPVHLPIRLGWQPWTKDPWAAPQPGLDAARDNSVCLDLHQNGFGCCSQGRPPLQRPLCQQGKWEFHGPRHCCPQTKECLIDV